MSSRCSAFYREGRAGGSFDAASSARSSVCSSARSSCCASKRIRRRRRPDSVYRISDVELASRLSFFLWSSIPDEELLDAGGAEAARATGGARPAGAADARRLPRSTRSSRISPGSGCTCATWPPRSRCSRTSPTSTTRLRQAFRTRDRAVLRELIREDRSALDLLRADYTFLNERLARHYGIADVKGRHFRRVDARPASRRGGLLGQGSILTVTSYPDRTSPVMRGKWILENMLGTPPPAPPPDVPAAQAAELRGEGAVRCASGWCDHRRNPACASCHAMMDPLGLALENFDAVGKWRALDESGGPIDASGSMPDGTKFDGAGRTAAGAARIRPVRHDAHREADDVRAGPRRRLLRRAGRPRHRPRPRRATTYRFVVAHRGIVQSAPFQMRRAK